MRLDKYLKVSRLIKRRTVANEACDAGRVLINDKVAKASANVSVGDVLLQVLLHAQIATEGKRFDISDVIDGLSKKMIRRHPHVFGGAPQASTPEEGLANWKAIKEKEKEAKKLAQKNV